MSAKADQWLRVVPGLTLPLLLALPTWWSLRAEGAELRATKALLEVDLATLAPGAARGNESNRLRAEVLARKAVVETIATDRAGSLQWLSVLGTLPEGIVLTRATLRGAQWEISGLAASGASLAALPAHFERAGFVSDGIEAGDAAQAGGPFRLRGRAAGTAEAAPGP